MADNLIFPIGFDLEKGVKDAQAQMDSVLRRLQKTVDGKPLTIPMSLDASKFTTFEAALRGSIQNITDDAKKLKAALDNSLKTDNSANINRITEAMRNLEAAWKALPNNQKFDINDRLTPKAQDMVRQFNELATASSTYGQTLSQIAGKIKRAADEEAKANQKRNDGYAKLRKTLGAQENSIANLSAKIKAYQQILNSKEIGSRSFERVAEKIRKLTEQLDKAKAKVAELTGKAQSGASRQAAAVRQVSQEFNKQDSYLTNLLKKTLALWSIHQVGSSLTNIKEVTAQFELQRVSLGAIIQDQNRANQLFSEIKSFALKSPVSILDLTKYTKQLAAYKVGWDGVKTDTKELFDWTKKLTDVSVGLGVSMDRVVLAFGQVRATGYLRASEVRQFTEMGVPIVEELAEKMKKLNGEAVTTEQVMDLISKRAISFDMVKEVFDDMTSAGGMFYNMQEKQGNTLYGMWAKLGDAASVMYDEIGNTESVNKGMKAAIQALTDLMRNWQQIPRMIAFAGATTLVFVTRQKILKLETAKVAAIQETYNARMARTNMLLSSSSRLTRAHGFALGAQARMLKMASTAAAAFGTSLTAIKSAIISTGWGALIMALGYIADKLLFTKTNAEKAAEAISKISEETATETAKSVRNFEYLANKAVNAPKGSTEQKEALEELERTYSNILPKELLELEYLDKLDGKYGSLTKTIREYIAEQQRRKAIEEIGNVYGAEKQKYERKLTDYFRGQGWTEGEIARFWEKFYDVAKDKSKRLQEVVAESVKFAGREGFEDVFKLLQSQNSATKEFDKARAKDLGEWAMWGDIDYIDMLRDAVLEENQAIEQNEERTKAAQNATNAFADAQEKAAKRLKEVRLFDTKGESIDRDSYLGGQALANFEIKDMTNILKDGFAQAGLVWDAEYGNFINHINEKTPELISSLNFDAIIDAIINALNNPDLTEAQRQFLENLLSVAQQSKKRYEEIVPADPIVRVAQTRFKQIAQSAGGFREQYNQYLMKAGEDMATYNKRLKDSLEDLKNRVKALLDTQKVIAKAGIFAKMRYEVSAEELQKDIDETNKTISIIEKTLSEQSDYSKSRKKGGAKSDPRLQILNEMVQLAEKLNKEYSDWEKKVGSTKALEKVNDTYAETVKYAEKVAKNAGISLPHLKTPTNAKELNKYLEAVRKVMESTKGLKGGKKAAIELAVKMSNNVSAEAQKAIEEKIKKLADRISRTKTAKEFYEKILGQTGNRDMAKRLVTSIFGENGEKLNKEIAERLRKMVERTSATLPDFVFNADMSVNSKALRGWVEVNKTALGDVAKELAKFANESEKDTAKMIEGWLKATEKAKTYGDKLADVYRTTATEIARIEAEMTKGNLGRDIGTELIAGYRRKEAEEVAKLQYEAFKDSPMYVQMFDDLDHASTRMLENMKSRLESLQGAWRNLDPTQLKEMQSRLREIDEQLAKRNPFKVMADGLREYTRLRTKGDARGNTSRANADRDATEWAEKYLEAQEELAKITSDPTATEAQIAGARQMVDYTKRQKDEAEKTAANWKKVEDAIGLSANQLMQMLNWGGDIAHAIADISESMGADEEDVQYWNDIASGLDEVSGAIQDIVSAAMSGNVVGVISSALTAIPKMFVGFANIFAAGKIKRANKEIKRQQELIEALEYSYSRLEKAAEKTFGADYLRNVNERLRMLKAEAEAYRKQAEAERSKGKKRDKEAEKEYLEHARDTADEIEELNRELQEKITGTTVEKAAEDFASAWLDAYLSFGNTAEAIKEKFRDMMKTMVVNMALSGVVERMLKPLMDMIDERAADGELSSREIAEIMGAVPGYVDDIDNAMTVAMEALKAAGVDVGQLRDAADTETRGIAKGVASATSEEINAATAVGKTLLYYANPIPRIDENLARVVAIMESRGIASPTASGTTTGVVDYTGMFNTANQHLSSLPRMEQHLAEIHTMLGRALKTKGSTTGFNTFLN